MSDLYALAIVGLRGSGKTTYLGCLLDGVETGRVPGITQRSQPEDATAMIQLTARLLEGLYPLRTSTEQRHDLHLPLRTTPTLGTERALDLFISDYDGQEIERLFTDRAIGWSAAWRSRADAQHLLLFLRLPEGLPAIPPKPADSPTDPWQILRAQAARPLVDPPPDVTPAATPERIFGPAFPKEWSPSSAPLPDDPVPLPRGLELIEVLQFLREHRGLAPGQRPDPGQLRIAVMISGWDAAPPAWRDQGPRAALRQLYPLLATFLYCNFAPADIYAFGVSATGGDLNDPVYREQFVINEASGFVEWDGPTGLRHIDDIGLPLYWILTGDPVLSLGAPSSP